jgi:2-methylisocitrate lyase-like PEP mutase family enzyme
VAEAGAKAVATGSASVAAAYGFADGEAMPLDLVLANAERIVRAVDLPVSIDFEGGYAVAPQAVAANAKRLAETGAVGCNFEDQVIGGEGLHAVALQVERIRVVRAVVGPDFFLNARTDIFLKAPRDTHDEAMVEEAVARAHAYAAAGASGFFPAGLVDLRLVERVCKDSPLPVNVLPLPGGPAASAYAAAGAARISYGPFPYRGAMKALREAAEGVYG